MPVSFLIDAEVQAFEFDAVVVAGFTGRDRASVQSHLRELEELGVPTPPSTPSYYVAPPSAAVQTDTVTTVQPTTSGEAECVLIVRGDDMWITLGSDHTDRDAETLDIALSKIVCPKPLASEAWTWESVADHLDSVRLQSWITVGSDPELYQDGSLAEIMPLKQLIEHAPFNQRPDTFAMFTGTVPAIGGIRPASRFRASLTDPVAGRAIELDYGIRSLDAILDPHPDPLSGSTS